MIAGIFGPFLFTVSALRKVELQEAEGEEEKERFFLGLFGEQRIFVRVQKYVDRRSLPA